MMLLTVVSENADQPVSFGLYVVRQVAQLADAIICYATMQPIPLAHKNVRQCTAIWARRGRCSAS